MQHGAKSPFAPAIVYAAGQGHPVLERHPLESPMYLNRSQSFFRGNDWEVPAPTTVTVNMGGDNNRRNVQTGSGYLSAYQLETLSPKMGEYGAGGSGADLLSMITKGAGPGSPLYAAMVSATMNPVSENEKR